MQILTVDNLTLTVGDDLKIKGGSFGISSGDVVLLTGPNGCGKSTVIKTIMGALLNSSNICPTVGEIAFFKNGKETVLSTEASFEFFRKNVVYVSQEDEFETESVLECFLGTLNFLDIPNKAEYVLNFVKTFSIADCFSISANGKLNGKARRIARKLNLNCAAISSDDEKAVKLLAMSNKKMSGGQKKLANIVTNLIRYEYCDLLLFDEPLNNLDYNNVRAFSNMLTRIHRQKPELAMLIVTHCRSIPVINRVLEIKPNTCEIVEGTQFICNSCFGNLSDEKIYI